MVATGRLIGPAYLAGRYPVHHPLTRPDLDASLPPREAAAGALRRRLKAVGALARKCRKDASPARVHALRTGIRRAEAAIDSFRPFLGERAVRRTTRELHVLRRRAGTVRDLDVTLEILRELAAADPGDGTVVAAIQDLSALRDAAADRLAGERFRRSTKRVRRRRRSLVRGEGDSAELPPLANIAKMSLRSTIESARARAAARGATPQDLHALRIELRRLRHAIELLEPALPVPAPGAAALALRAAIDTLGRLNDSVKMVATLQGMPAGALHGTRDDLVNRMVRLRDRRTRDAIATATGVEGAILAPLGAWLESQERSLAGADTSPPRALGPLAPDDRRPLHA